MSIYHSFIVYQTTNLINGKIYVGVHGVKIRERGLYLGSGKGLVPDVKKYGKENFKREILFEFEATTIEELQKESGEWKAFEKEKEIVNIEFLSRKDVYNRIPGAWVCAWMD